MYRFQVSKRAMHTEPGVLGNLTAVFITLHFCTRFPQDTDCDVLPTFHILKPKLTSITDNRCGHKFKITPDNLQMFNNHTVHNTDAHGSLLYCIRELNKVCEKSTTTYYQHHHHHHPKSTAQWWW